MVNTAAGGIGEFVNGGAGAITSPLALLNRIARKMDQANVDQDGRWVVLDPVMIELLMDEDSKFVDRDFGGGDEIRTGRMGGNLVLGFPSCSTVALTQSLNRDQQRSPRSYLQSHRKL